MSFFSSLGNFFGFGNDDADYNDLVSEENQPTIIRPVITVDTPESQTADNDGHEEEPEFVKSEEIPVEKIFEKVVDIFNRALPDFIAQSIDKEKQQRQIYEALDSSLKQYIKALSQNADRDANLRWQNERKRLLAEIDQHREASKRQSETEEGLVNQRLSAERQKRALSERVNDLESQIATLEAEREQFELEKKSLVNKLRATTVQEGEGDPAVISEATQLLYDRISDLETKVSDLEGEREQLVIENKSLNNKLRVAAIQGGNPDPTIIPDSDKSADTIDIAEHQQKIDELNGELEQIKTKLELAESMTRESQSIASSTKKELKDRETLIEKLNQEISSLKSSAKISDDKVTVNTSTINELEEKNKELSQQIETLNEELNAANENLQTLELIEEQIEKFEEIKQKKDAKIKELNESQQSLLEKIKWLEEERIGLKRTVETSINDQSKSEISLRDEIDRLKQENERLKEAHASIAADDVPVYSTPEPITEIPVLEPLDATEIAEKTTIISAIDESLDNTDWLVATPPEGTSMRSLAKNDDQSDFGYQAPAPRKPMPDSDAQMSLWDDM